MTSLPMADWLFYIRLIFGSVTDSLKPGRRIDLVPNSVGDTIFLKITLKIHYGKSTGW